MERERVPKAEQKGESNGLCPANDGKKQEPNAPDAQMPALAISN
jgi:hypothetical protein